MIKKMLAIVIFFQCNVLFANELEDFRIISIGGGATEIVYALEGEKYLVGVDTSSTWPQAAQHLPQVGYQRTLTPESLLSLQPTVLLGTSHTGPQSTLDALEKAGVQVVILPSTLSLETVKARIEEVATLLHTPKRGHVVWQDIDRQIAEAKKWQQAHKTIPKTVLFLLVVPGHPPMVAGLETEASFVLSLAGAQNVITDFTNYRVLSPEALHTLHPDVIVVTEEGVKSVGGLEAMQQQLGITTKNTPIIVVDANAVLNLGPRLGEAVLTLTKSLYPQSE